jgi:hypothetical protein
MDLYFLFNLGFIIAVNVMFFVLGVCLNCLVIISFWRSAKLRKKLCYFMIMVLSCCDLLAVVANHPLTVVAAMLWLTENLDGIPKWMYISLSLTSTFVAFSLLALLVMNFDRYLATYYPLFHRTSITKRTLLFLLGILIFVEAVIALLTVNDFIISGTVHALFFCTVIFPPMLFINCKLFVITRKSRVNNGISPEIKKTFSYRNISSCLLAVVSFIVLSTPAYVYYGIRATSKETKFTLDGLNILRLWIKTVASINSTFNCLIFYWKNRVLRAEGMKIALSLYRRVKIK